MFIVENSDLVVNEVIRVNGLDGQARTLRALKKCHKSTRCGFDSHLTL